MGRFDALVVRFPQRELEIRRHCTRDAHFRAICGDYEEAASALRRWQMTAGEGDPRITDYRSLLAELEVEILTRLGSTTALR